MACEWTDPALPCSVLHVLLQLKIDTIELLNDAGSEYTSGTKLHFKIRLKAKDYADTKALHDAADAIVVQVRRADFGARLVEALDATGQMLDGPQISRFGWLFNEDIEVSHNVCAVWCELRHALPMLLLISSV